MLRQLRLWLTLLYLGVSVALIALMGAGSYLLLSSYFVQTTDLALRWSVAQQFKAVGAPLPAELAEADRSWPVSQGRPTRRDHDDDHEYDERLNPSIAAVFVVRLTSDGSTAGAAGPLPILPDRAALNAALQSGGDLRTVSAPNGERVRLLTYRLNGPDRQAAVQAGRLLDDQDRTLARLVAGLLALGSVSAGLLGIGSWWLAGRTIRPAEQAWAQQQAFVANASHEIRTPLTLIRATAEVAKRGNADPDTAALLDDVLSECDYLSALTEDLLLLSRLDAGRLQLDRQQVPLAPLLEDLQRQLGRVAVERGVSVSAALDDLAVLADPTRLRQVLLIVLDNALRYTPAGGSVRVAAEVTGKAVRISVTDTGEGIAGEHLPRVFDRFYRVDQARGAGNGTGLGLAVAKSLVEAQHGTIGIASELGKGTRVTIELPGA